MSVIAATENPTVSSGKMSELWCVATNSNSHSEPISEKLRALLLGYPQGCAPFFEMSVTELSSQSGAGFGRCGRTASKLTRSLPRLPNRSDERPSGECGCGGRARIEAAGHEGGPPISEVPATPPRRAEPGGRTASTTLLHVSDERVIQRRSPRTQTQLIRAARWWYRCCLAVPYVRCDRFMIVNAIGDWALRVRASTDRNP
jgi:hypothetical protein